MTNSALNSVVDPANSDQGPVNATVVRTDGTLIALTLPGSDSTRFAKIRQLIGGSVTALILDDQDGPAATGWIDDEGVRKGLPANDIASAVADRPVVGPMVITGRGQGDDQCLTSVHPGLQSVLEEISRERLALGSSASSS